MTKSIKRLFTRIPLHLLLVFITGFVAYSNTFEVPFQFDDEDFIISTSS